MTINFADVIREQDKCHTYVALSGLQAVQNCKTGPLAIVSITAA